METPEYIKQLITNIKELIDSNTIIVGNTPLTSMDRSSKQKINKETMALSGTLDQRDLTDIFRTFHLKTAEYTSFSRQLKHCPEYIIYRNKTNINKFQKIKVILLIFHLF